MLLLSSKSTCFVHFFAGLWIQSNYRNNPWVRHSILAWDKLRADTRLNRWHISENLASVKRSQKGGQFFHVGPSKRHWNQARRQGGCVGCDRTPPPPSRSKKVYLEVTCSAENVNLWKKTHQRLFVTVSSVLFCCRSLRTVFVLLIYLSRRTDYERIGSSIQTVQ